MVEKDTRKEDELTEADYLDRFNIRCNAKKFFEDLVLQAESTNIASTCSDANIQIDEMTKNLNEFILFLFESDRTLLKKCTPDVM